jgi:hypothetical protein
MNVLAVKPARGRVVHLHSSGYQPGEKLRPHADRVALCGYGIWPNGNPVVAYVPTPLVEALRWTSLAPSETDPRPTWSWCRPCVGHVVVAHGMTAGVLAQIAGLVTT